MVTSLSTPSPAITMPQVSSVCRSILAREASRRAVSSTSPVRWAAPVPHRASSTVSTIPATVPSRAVVVRMDTPWAT